MNGPKWKAFVDKMENGAWSVFRDFNRGEGYESVAYFTRMDGTEYYPGTGQLRLPSGRVSDVGDWEKFHDEGTTPAPF